MPSRPPITMIALSSLALLPAAWFRGSRRSFEGQAGELLAYRSTVNTQTSRIDAVLSDLGELVDALRRRDVDIDEAVDRLAAGEDELDAIAEDMREMEAPADLHELHLEYEANLERALRGIVTAERGCGLTRQRHRPLEDEEPLAYWKRGYANIVHSRMRMAEVAEVMVAWEPGRPTVADVSARVRKHG
jgi:exonuclease VII small subunit